MPKNTNEDGPETTGRTEPEAHATDTTKDSEGKKEARGRRSSGLRKSEAKGEKEDKPLLGRVFRKRTPKSKANETVVEPVVDGPALEPPVIVAPKGAEDILAHLSWRPRQGAPQVMGAESESRPRRQRQPIPKPEAAKEGQPKPEPPVRRPAKKEAPKPKWEPVRIPESANQVIVHGGLPSLVNKKRIIPPLFLTLPLAEAKKSETVTEELRMASERGVHAVCILFQLTVDAATVERQVEAVSAFAATLVDADGDAKFILRAQIVAPAGWQKTFKKAVYGSKGESQPSICDDEFWVTAEECVKSFVGAIKKSKVHAHILGMHVDRTGWFYANGSTHDDSASSKEKFGAWLRQRYRDDKVSLRAAWYDGKVDFDTIVPPSPANGSRGEEFVRIGRSGRRWVDYNLFLSDVTVDRIAQLAYAIKKESGGMWLVGTNYGYTFEWSYPSSGHLSLGKLLRCPSIDYVSGPSSYKAREPGASSPFPGPIDSFALNGKLFVSEDDFRTPISGSTSASDIPLMKTPQALESAHWRSAGAALAHSSGTSWADQLGEGWLASRGIWERAQAVNELFVKRYVANRAPAEVAVLIDERSLAYLVDTRAFEVLVQNVRESVLRSGLSADFFLLSDLAHRENFPEAKLYLFLNAWDVRPEVRSAIKTRLQKDNKVLFWLYCAGLFEAGRDALERVREVTGIALKPQPFHSKPGTALLNLRHPLCATLPPERMAGGGQLEPSYFAIPEDGVIFGEYVQTGLPSFVMREFHGENDGEGSWKTVFLGEPVVTPGLFRALGQMAGAHVWNFDDDVVHAKPPFLTIHCKGAGPRTVTLPNNWSAYDVIQQEWVGVESNGIRFTAIDGATYVFFVGMRSEIEALLKDAPTSLLDIEKIDPREENTVHWDSVQFDVEIMKLDEWVEENWSEAHADDLLLKPSMIDIDHADEPEEPEPVDDRRMSRGRRRGRGRRGGQRGPRGGSEESASARREGADMEFDDAGVGVMFRKKQ